MLDQLVHFITLFLDGRIGTGRNDLWTEFFDELVQAFDLFHYFLDETLFLHTQMYPVALNYTNCNFKRC